MTAAFSLDDLRLLVGGRFGVYDGPCPECGPHRRAPKNRTRPVMRVWYLDERFATWCCARCGSRGEAHAGSRESGRRIDPESLRVIRAAAAVRDREAIAVQLGKALWLWRRRADPRRSVVEVYLRDVRRYGGTIPATVGYLAPYREHGPAMITCYGMPSEPEPGILVTREEALRGVQITRLLPDGAKVPGSDKISIGRSAGWPTVLAPLNDGLGLAICEGTEDALSIAEATGLGAWAAGGASRLPALAERVPDYIDAVSVVADSDEAGRRNAQALVGRLRLRLRGLRAEIVALGDAPTVAA